MTNMNDESHELSLLESGGDTTTSSTHAPASPNQTPILRKDDVIDQYEAMLVKAEWFARVVGFLYAGSRFMGYCNLTWATVVVLGGFCSLLHPWDLWSVAALLVAEAARLATATFFSTLRNQSHFRFHGLSLMFTRLFSYSTQYGINLAVSIVTGKRIRHLNSYSHVDTSSNLRPALLLFYRLLQANSYLNLAAISVDNLSIYLRARLLRGPELSLLRYYEHVLEKLLRSSLGLADPIDFFHFAYVHLLGREFGRNVKTDVLVKQYGKMLDYLHAHRQGFDSLFVYLEHGDASVQQAAANVTGLWMSRPTTRCMVESLPEGLVTRLLRRLPDGGEVGRAAANSLCATAGYGKGDLLLSFGTKVGDALAAAIDPTTSRSLVLVRAMVFLVHGQVKELSSPPMPSPEDPVLSKIFSVHRREHLEKDLETLMRDARVHRLRTLSAYLLFLLGRNPTLILPDADPFLGIMPTSDCYWLSREKEMMEQLYDRFTTTGRSGIPGFPNRVLREDRKLAVPVWALTVA